jgi:cation transport regulator ChaB
VPAPLLTFGHGRLDSNTLSALVRDAGIELVVDVRRFPGSRANDAAARGAIPALLETVGIEYRWDQRLGGRRNLTKAEDESSPDTWWRVKAFRGYAAWTRSEDFRAALPELLADVDRARTAVLCSEAVWWRCHRRMIADVVLLELGVEVCHLMHTGALNSHSGSEGARLDADGRLVWDGEPQALYTAVGDSYDCRTSRRRTGMPKTNKKGRAKQSELPETLKKSDRKAQDTFAKTYDSAAEQYDDTSRVAATAWAAVKHTHEKVGDHWEQKSESGPSDPSAEKGGRNDEPTHGGVDANASKEHLYELAKKLDIAGRSKMNKEELVKALEKASDRANSS